jgi:hypothetical protein
MGQESNRSLTFDEKKAAEAAFRGLPLNLAWSESAQAIYHGIVAETGGRNILELEEREEAGELEGALS